MQSQLRIRCCLAAFSLVVLATSAIRGQAIDPVQAVGVRVIRPSLGSDERGSGFVISVDSEAVYILSARHLFYSGKLAFRQNIKVIFALDRLNEHEADWYVDFVYLDLAVLKVSMSKLPPSLSTPLKDLPLIKVRPGSQPLRRKEDIFLVGGKFQDWQLPKDSVSGLQDDIDRMDRFRFTGTGVHDGFSGSAVLDGDDRLVGIHLGSVPSDDDYGRAQRFADAIPILVGNRIPMNKLDSAAPESVAPPIATTASRAAGELRTNKKDGLTYVWIPAGVFQMGCSAGETECYDEEKPAHRVTIAKGFWLSQTPITQAAFERITRTNPSYFKGSELPVENASWNDAEGYCKATGGRLPTEAEWEYAARAGNTQSRYGALDAIAWHLANSGGKTHPVGTKKQNAWNLYDMLGNVWQWTADWYDPKYYSNRAVTDPHGPPTGTARALRGGSWYNSPRDVRASNRYRNVPGDHDINIGARCVGEAFP